MYEKQRLAWARGRVRAGEFIYGKNPFLHIILFCEIVVVVDHGICRGDLYDDFTSRICIRHRHSNIHERARSEIKTGCKNCIRWIYMYTSSQMHVQYTAQWRARQSSGKLDLFYMCSVCMPYTHNIYMYMYTQ